MLPLCDLLINIELEALNKFYLSNDSNKSLKFFINRESGSDSCGSLTLAESSSDLPSLDLPKVSPGSPKRGMKRESNVSLKPCVPSKVTKGDPSPTKDISNKASSNLGELKKTTHKIFTLQNRNICEQDTENRSLSLSIILSSRHQIFCQECSELQEKV